LSELEKQIIETFNFSEEEYKSIEKFFHSKKLKKGEYFLKEGYSARQMGFVEKGILREYLYLNDKEITKWFSTKGNFAVDLTAFLSNHKSRVNYQAVTDTQMLTLSKNDYDKLGDKLPRWHKLEKMFLAKCFSILENRVISHLGLDSEARYSQFFSLYPTLFNQVPLNQLASLLGMTAETLSRIRKKQAYLNS